MKQFKIFIGIFAMVLFTSIVLLVPMLYYMSFDNDLLSDENVVDLGINYQKVELTPQQVADLRSSENRVEIDVDDSTVNSDDIYSSVERCFKGFFADDLYHSEIAYAARKLLSNREDNELNYNVKTIIGDLPGDVSVSVTLADVYIFDDTDKYSMELSINYTSNQIYSISITNISNLLTDYEEYYSNLSEQTQKNVVFISDELEESSLWYKHLTEYWDTSVENIAMGITLENVYFQFLQNITEINVEGYGVLENEYDGEKTKADY